MSDETEKRKGGKEVRGAAGGGMGGQVQGGVRRKVWRNAKEFDGRRAPDGFQ